MSIIGANNWGSNTTGTSTRPPRQARGRSRAVSWALAVLSRAAQATWAGSPSRNMNGTYADAVKRFEGFTPRATWDYKQNSNGYGTRAAYPGEQIDRATAEQRFADEFAKARSHVDSFAPNAPEGVKGALTSLTYNAGPGWSNSGLGRAVQAGDWDGARQHFLQYNKAGGVVNPGLVSRREQEAAVVQRQRPGPRCPHRSNRNAFAT
jgi:GH24 family phage-related lysozyme (muramidase)